jgi:phosphoenolpyruvate carboxykinase (diphosphate)
VHRYLGAMATRLARAVPVDKPIHLPVHSVLVGRRNNPADYGNGIRPLAVYNPIHYQELPELFMDFICALTGKSPSTTGVGSEGALTKGPFNALLPITDLNAALVSYLLTGLAGFSTPAGHIGSNVRVDHDISLLIPEIWCRLTPQEREPALLLQEGLLEKLDDYEYDGRTIMASRLGYRITSRFIRTFAGRVFDNPRKVFDDAILRPETQDEAAFADGISHITEAQQRVATNYLKDGSIDLACPPLRALLHIMAEGEYRGQDAHSPEVRELFTLDSMLNSDWYTERLKTRRQRDQALWQRHSKYLRSFLNQQGSQDDMTRLELTRRLNFSNQQLERVSQSEYLQELHGTLGADRLS